MLKESRSSSQAARSAGKTRYALCGLSTRGIYSYVKPLLTEWAGTSEVVGIMDIDEARVEECQRAFSWDIPFFPTERGADALIREAEPDVLIVTGPDYTHYEYILAGLRSHLTVISEKPMVINCQQARDVLALTTSGHGRLIVAHNYRYAALSRKIKELLLAGAVGRITNVEMVYNLDTFHGASYFYRWNRLRKNSGGLSIHKCVHHMDLLNWWINSTPETVVAFGALNYYGAHGAHKPRRPDGSALSLKETREQCPYFQKHYAPHGVSPERRPTPGWDQKNLPMEKQYPKDLYIYDDEIDIEDTYSALLRYQNGVSVSYSCNFSTPWEGYVLGINGTKGRLEVAHRSNPDPTGHSKNFPGNDVIRVMPLFGEESEHGISSQQGGHGGADPLIQKDLFGDSSAVSAQLDLQADGQAGALAIAMGEAMWRSIAEDRSIKIAELLGEYSHP
jgi:predicted dehydrogenase